MPGASGGARLCHCHQSVHALTAAEGLKSANRKQARERRVEDEQVFRLRPNSPCAGRQPSRSSQLVNDVYNILGNEITKSKS